MNFDFRGVLTTDVLASRRKESDGAGPTPGFFHFTTGAYMAEQLRKFAPNPENVAMGSDARFYDRGEAVAELAADVAAREEKTARLREARFAKERRDMMAATAVKLAQRGKLS